MDSRLGNEKMMFHSGKFFVFEMVRVLRQIGKGTSIFICAKRTECGIIGAETFFRAFGKMLRWNGETCSNDVKCEDGAFLQDGRIACLDILF